MRCAALLSALCAVSAVLADPQTAEIYLQPVGNPPSQPPSLLAEVSYDLSALSASSVLTYEAPDIPEAVDLVQIGLYDTNSKLWISGTTAASSKNFDKGYSPHILLSVDSIGRVLSVAVKGIRIDAGQTRDFGPKLHVLPEQQGKTPILNAPVVLTPEGKRAQPEPEKTFLQKYWWMIAIAVLLALSGGGGDK